MSRPETDEIYHLIAAADWARAGQSGVVSPDSLARDGFLHCCDRARIGFVLARFFPGRADMLALTIDPARTCAELRWEHSELDQPSFPHLYGTLPVSAVLAVTPALDLVQPG